MVVNMVKEYSKQKLMKINDHFHVNNHKIGKKCMIKAFYFFFSHKHFKKIYDKQLNKVWSILTKLFIYVVMDLAVKPVE